MPKNINLKLEDDNIKILENISKNSKIPVTRIINMLISTLDNKSEFMNNNLSTNPIEEDSELRINLTVFEKEFLIKQASINQSKTLSAEIKYRILNTMYKNKYFTNMELSNFMILKREINTIGRNLNQLLKLLHTKSNLSVDDNVFKNMLNDININIKELSKSLENIIEQSKNRY